MITVDEFKIVAAPVGFDPVYIGIETPFDPAAVVTVTAVPGSGALLLADSTVLVPGDQITTTQLAGLKFVAGEERSGSGTFQYTVSHSGEEASGGVGLATTGSGAFYFTAFDQALGRELRQLDENGNLTAIEVNPGLVDSDAKNLFEFEGNLYFSAFDEVNGTELRRLDANGNLTTFDINAGAASSNPQGFIEFESALYFSATDASNGSELRRLNPDGSIVVFDVNPGSGGSFPKDAIAFGRDLYFSAIDGTNGHEIRRLLDGDQIETIDSVVGAGGLAPTDFTIYNNELHFVGTDLQHGSELRRLENDDSITTFEIIPGSVGSSAGANGGFIEFNGKLYFPADDGAHGGELWQLDAAGNVSLVSDVHPTAGSAPGSQGGFIVFNESLYFNAADPNNGVELRKLDTAGVINVIDVNPPYANSNAGYGGFIVYNDELYFSAHPGSVWGGGARVFKLDANDDVTNMGGGSNGGLLGFAEFDGDVYFTAYLGSIAVFKLDASGNLSFLPESFPGTPTSVLSANGLFGLSETLMPLGTDGNDILISGGNDEQLEGGLGNDVYFVDSSFDSIVENVGAGDDLVYTTVSFDVPANVEVLIMTGSGDLNTTGTSNRDIIQGNSGENIINGAGGFDVMQGGAGNDTYAVNHASDAVIENVGGGYDNLYTSVDYILEIGSEIESVILTENALLAFGNASDNQLFGNGIANVLFGRGGTDYMLGLGGDDIFVLTPENGTVDVIGDFEDRGPGIGDRLGISGFGLSADVVQVSQTSFEIRSADGLTTQQFILQGHDGSGLIAGDDYYFT